MCGRFVLDKAPREVARLFQLDEPPEILAPRYNIAPTQPVALLRSVSSARRTLSLVRWGLIPHWNRDPRHTGFVNGRAETAFEKPTFRESITRRRGIIPASGFYEWKTIGKKKWPYYFHMANHEVMPFAAVWDTWKSPNGTIESAAILTVPANDLVKPLHERMPAILRPDQFEAWLISSAESAECILPLLETYDVEKMEVCPVSDRVNAVTFEGATLIEPVTHPLPRQEQPGLFDIH